MEEADLEVADLEAVAVVDPAQVAVGDPGDHLEAVRLEVEKAVGVGPETKQVGNLPFTPRVKKVLALAGSEADAEADKLSLEAYFRRFLLQHQEQMTETEPSVSTAGRRRTSARRAAMRRAVRARLAGSIFC